MIGDFNRQWRRVFDKAGLPREAVFHDLRGAFCSHMEEAGVPCSRIMEISGHESEEIFRRYSRSNLERNREHVKKMEDKYGK